MTLQHLFFWKAEQCFSWQHNISHITSHTHSFNFPLQEYYSFVLGNNSSIRQELARTIWRVSLKCVPFIRQIPLYLFSNSPSRHLVAETYYTFGGSKNYIFYLFLKTPYKGLWRTQSKTHKTSLNLLIKF